MADEIVWKQYPDTTQRETYPPLPRTMGNPNAVASDAVLGTVLARMQQDRAKKGLEDLTPLLTTDPAPITEPIPDDPEAQAYRAAGWL